MIGHRMIPPLLHWRFGDAQAPAWFRSLLNTEIRKEFREREAPVPIFMLFGYSLLSVVMVALMALASIAHADSLFSTVFYAVVHAVFFVLLLCGVRFIVDIVQCVEWVWSCREDYGQIVRQETLKLTHHQRMDYAAHTRRQDTGARA